MERREFIGLAAALATIPAAVPAATGADETAIRQRIEDIYRAFSTGDVDRYRSYMASDYLLLENGEVIDLEGDIAFFMDRPDGYHRTDSFQFKHVGVTGDMAYAIYYVNALASDPQTPPKSLHWIESMVLRRTGGEWRCALIHSTVLVPPQIDSAGSDKG